VEKRYTALRIIATLYKIVGVIVGVLTLLGAVILLLNAPANYNFGIIQVSFGETIFAVLIELIAGGLTAIGTYAVGELISLFINIEENTRYTALIIRDRMQPQPAQPPYQPPAQPPYQSPTPPANPAPPPTQPPQG
jgi:hypothetical protein